MKKIPFLTVIFTMSILQSNVSGQSYTWPISSEKEFLDNTSKLNSTFGLEFSKAIRQKKQRAIFPELNFLLGYNTKRIKFKNNFAFEDRNNSLLAHPRKNLSEEYIDLYIGAKGLPLKAENGTIILSYTDESPSPDAFSSNREIKKSSYSINLEAGLEAGRQKGHHVELLAGGSFGKILVRFYGQFGFGWNFPVKNTIFGFRPVLNIAYGTIRYKLGDLVNNSIYVQVNDTRFYSESVKVSAATNTLSFIPRMDLTFKISRDINFKLHAGYHFTTLKGNPFIRFNGDGLDEESLIASEKITEKNVDLTVNGDRIRKMPVDLDGLTFGFGLRFKIGDDDH